MNFLFTCVYILLLFWPDNGNGDWQIKERIEYIGPWGQWTPVVMHKENFAGCGIGYRYEDTNSLVYDDIAGDGLAILACNRDDWHDQYWVRHHDAGHGLWYESKCPPGQYITSFITKNNPSCGHRCDDTAQTGVKIICMSYCGTNSTEVLVVDGFDGEWEQPYSHFPFVICGGKVQYQANENKGYLSEYESDYTGVNGYYFHVCN